ncbi:hypothetical protein [Pseudosporangium ferrugineum]|uniref:Fe-S cluster assembly iron-binding protein IscA n=1 Tax=Pseudosporangium ferrugineum TaxID=439699 RepID=A0A2T0RG74_9ACTN|nr:hypothetical protein [Pseudosporangium ferrugineum]PRY20206.1 hypothetical protein CLV70_12587 [Pseudosporangium ferrugineum]
MFTVSDTATAAIRRILRNSGTPPGGGVRIAAEPGRTSLHIAVSPAPHPGDTVHDRCVFIAEGTGKLLEGKILDAQEDDTRRVQFVLGDRRRNRSDSPVDNAAVAGSGRG